MAGQVQDPNGTVSNKNTAEETKITPLEEFTPDPKVDVTRTVDDKIKGLKDINAMEGEGTDVEAEKKALLANLPVNNTLS